MSYLIIWKFIKQGENEQESQTDRALIKQLTAISSEAKTKKYFWKKSETAAALMAGCSVQDDLGI